MSKMSWFRRRRRERQDAIRLLMQMPGKDAWLEARRRAQAFDILSGDQRAHWSRVAGRLDRMLGIEWQADTGTRYLES
ncbi:MAG TPA: hypothetical protein PKA33_16010 [Amaricoccus sp.]|uniref:hypothetical protein n=1 Tax=Amaricoccus sp. TaxID=1872485 RepID=UPI002B946165|nr:hypothetical protein [Amaricoccus sp.]HMQ92493.1 hypothetical protein [Amaricoccus sp.]HMR53858.1 hypothetical protein [Amaricoccus sp.]HMR58975.1 hypothetical protein [Amaricoccus sp.]HMU00853.1 hypothetical protein [Amaricoccus sp.]